jgi:hypothetical protein
MKRNPLKLPTEKIDLPSKGLIYPDTNLASLGYVEIIYPTAKEEDILTNSNYLAAGVAIDKFIDSILATDIDLKDLIPTDREAIEIAARILGIGREYTTSVGDFPLPVTFDLAEFKEREIDFSKFTKGLNEFEYQLGEVNIKFKLPTGYDAEAIKKEAEGLKKINKDYEAGNSLLFRQIIIEVNGDRSKTAINNFVDRLRMKHSKELYKHISSLTPGYTWKATGTFIKDGKQEKVEDLYVPFTPMFFWP